MAQARTESVRDEDEADAAAAVDREAYRQELKATAGLIDALIMSGRTDGYLTFDEVARAIGAAPRMDRAVNWLMKRLPVEGIEIRDSDYVPSNSKAAKEKERPSVMPTEEERLSETPAKSAAPPGVDPIQAYLGKMGSLSLLTREGEVEFARRIEKGRLFILWALARSSIRMPELTDLIERLEENDIRVRDVVDGMTSSTEDQEAEVRPDALRHLKRLKRLEKTNRRLLKELEGERRLTKRARGDREKELEENCQQRYEVLQELGLHERQLERITDRLKDYVHRLEKAETELATAARDVGVNDPDRKSVV